MPVCVYRERSEERMREREEWRCKYIGERERECVCERERERERESVCVCVCVCERERERESCVNEYFCAMFETRNCYQVAVWTASNTRRYYYELINDVVCHKKFQTVKKSIREKTVSLKTVIHVSVHPFVCQSVCLSICQYDCI